MEATSMSSNAANSNAGSNATTAAAAGRKVVYVISERNGKSYWTRIGFGSVNKDGSVNLKMDAIPVAGGTIQVRDWEPRDENRVGDRSALTSSAGTNAPARSAFI